MALWQWSTTPATNATAGAIDWAEGQPPSTVNNSARQMMADVAVWFAAPEWLNYGLTPTYSSTTSFTLAGNQTAIYGVGRRVQAFNTGGTVYGTIASSVFTSITTVTILPDSGALDSGLSEVDVGLLNSSNTSFPTGLNLTFGNVTATGTITGANVTATSDERLKTDWKRLDSDFLERLADVDAGTYQLIASGERHAGVMAQSLREVLPESVFQDDKGYLSVAYGNAALVAVIELAREVLRIRALLGPLG
jgi:hypothetical protein